MASGKTCTVHSKAGEVLDRIARINDALLVAVEEGSEAVLDLLRQLHAVPMTFEALETTKIGRAVNALRKSAPSDQARELAAALYRGWKALADESFAARQAAAAAAPTGDDAAARVEAASKADKRTTRSPPVETKRSAGASSRSVATPTVPEATPEEATQAIVKKQRIIRLVIKKAGQRPAVTQVQHRAALHAAVTANTTQDLNPRPAAASAVSLTKAKPATGPPKPVGSGACNRLVATTTVPEATPEEATPAIVKKQRSIRLVIKKAGERPAVAQVQHRAALHASVTANTTPDSNPSPAAASAVSLTKAKPAIAQPKPVGSGVCKRKEAPAAFDEARLARARMRLHEGHREASTVKEKRKIQVIDAPGKGGRCPRQVAV